VISPTLNDWTSFGRPLLLLPLNEEDWNLGVYDADFRLHEFFEALVRIASLKNYGLSALCDQVWADPDSCT
jgi:hypothetical protein